MGFVITPDGRTMMAKGQKRTNREAKKPKKSKTGKKLTTSSGAVSSAFDKPKSADAAGKRK